MIEGKKIYFNKPQLETMATAAHTRIFVGGRRLGKTHGIMPPWMLRNLQAMPGSSHGVIGSSFQQILTRTLPGSLKGFEDMGYFRNVHYTIGIRPPKGFARPVRQPVNFDHVICWYNGLFNI